MSLSGGCLCGAVRYEIEGAPLRVVNCYCADCRKAGGALFHTGVAVSRSQFRLTGGKPKTYAMTGDSGNGIVRHFCPTCGGGLYNEPSLLPDFVVVRAGSLDDPSSLSPTSEIYARSKPAWLEAKSVTESFPGARPAK